MIYWSQSKRDHQNCAQLNSLIKSPKSSSKQNFIIQKMLQQEQLIKQLNYSMLDLKDQVISQSINKDLCIKMEQEDDFSKENQLNQVKIEYQDITNKSGQKMIKFEHSSEKNKPRQNLMDIVKNDKKYKSEQKSLKCTDFEQSNTFEQNRTKLILMNEKLKVQQKNSSSSELNENNISDLNWRKIINFDENNESEQNPVNQQNFSENYLSEYNSKNWKIHSEFKKVGHDVKEPITNDENKISDLHWEKLIQNINYDDENDKYQQNKKVKQNNEVQIQIKVEESNSQQLSYSQKPSMLIQSIFNHTQQFQENQENEDEEEEKEQQQMSQFSKIMNGLEQFQDEQKGENDIDKEQNETMEIQRKVNGEEKQNSEKKEIIGQQPSLEQIFKEIKEKQIKQTPQDLQNSEQDINQISLQNQIEKCIDNTKNKDNKQNYKNKIVEYNKTLKMIQQELQEVLSKNENLTYSNNELTLQLKTLEEQKKTIEMQFNLQNDNTNNKHFTNKLNEYIQEFKQLRSKLDNNILYKEYKIQADVLIKQNSILFSSKYKTEQHVNLLTEIINNKKQQPSIEQKTHIEEEKPFDSKYFEEIMSKSQNMESKIQQLDKEKYEAITERDFYQQKFYDLESQVQEQSKTQKKENKQFDATKIEKNLNNKKSCSKRKANTINSAKKQYQEDLDLINPIQNENKNLHSEQQKIKELHSNKKVKMKLNAILQQQQEQELCQKKQESDGKSTPTFQKKCSAPIIQNKKAFNSLTVCFCALLIKKKDKIINCVQCQKSCHQKCILDGNFCGPCKKGKQTNSECYF